MMRKTSYKLLCLSLACAFCLGLAACRNATDPVDGGKTAESRLFWVDDLTERKAWVQAKATLAYQTLNCNIYVRNEDADKISQSLLKEYGDYFTRNSQSVRDYVFAPAEFFEEPGNRVNIFFYKFESELAGYFWDKDFFEDSLAGNRSNETNVLYMNIDSAVAQVAANQPDATLFTKGTLIHEFQHMCNAHYFNFGPGKNRERQMDSWANEFCSTTVESVFSDQLYVYLNQYLDRDTSPAGTYADFISGKTDFLYWTNDFTQYVVASLLGTYLLSAIDPGNRPNLISTFLEKTGQEDTTPAAYDYSGAKQAGFLSSVEDLIATLQDASVGYAAKTSGWVSVTNFSLDSSAIAGDWSIVMKNFLTALVGKDSSYASYVNLVTALVTKDPVIVPPVTTASGNSLKPSGFMIGRTKVASLSSTKMGDAQASGTDAYVLVWNGAIPTNSALGSDTVASLPSGIPYFASGVLLARPADEPLGESSRSLKSGFRWNRSMSGRMPVTLRARSTENPSGRASAIPGAGNEANSSDGTSTGKLSCAYVGL